MFIRFIAPIFVFLLTAEAPQAQVHLEPISIEEVADATTDWPALVQNLSGKTLAEIDQYNESLIDPLLDKRPAFVVPSNWTGPVPDSYCGFFRISGVLASGDAARLKEAIDKHSTGVCVGSSDTPVVLVLDFAGGNLAEALAIIDEFRELPMLVPKNANCLSACALIFLAGGAASDDIVVDVTKSRWLHVDANLGFHAPHSQLKGSAQQGDDTLNDVYDASFAQATRIFKLLRASLSQATIDKILSKDATEFLYVDDIQTAFDFGINLFGYAANPKQERFSFSYSDELQVCDTLFAKLSFQSDNQFEPWLPLLESEKIMFTDTNSNLYKKLTNDKRDLSGYLVRLEAGKSTYYHTANIYDLDLQNFRNCALISLFDDQNSEGLYLAYAGNDADASSGELVVPYWLSFAPDTVLRATMSLKE